MDVTVKKGNMVTETVWGKIIGKDEKEINTTGTPFTLAQTECLEIWASKNLNGNVYLHFDNITPYDTDGDFQVRFFKDKADHKWKLENIADYPKESTTTKTGSFVGQTVNVTIGEDKE